MRNEIHEQFHKLDEFNVINKKWLEEIEDTVLIMKKGKTLEILNSIEAIDNSILNVDGEDLKECFFDSVVAPVPILKNSKRSKDEMPPCQIQSNIDFQRNVIIETNDSLSPFDKRGINRHVSFGTPDQSMGEIDSSIPSPLFRSDRIHEDNESEGIILNESDISSSGTETSTQQIDDDFHTPTRESAVSIALKSSFERLSTNSASKVSFDNPLEYDSLVTPPKEINRSPKWADADSLRMSFGRPSLGTIDSQADSTHSNMIDSEELTKEAQRFREKWLKIVQEKSPSPDGDESDIDTLSTENDETMFSSDVEINSNSIPQWADESSILKALNEQKSIDPDTIFTDFHPTCALSEVFNHYNPQWQLRNESQKWDKDGITKEEITMFKKAIGLQ